MSAKAKASNPIEKQQTLVEKWRKLVAAKERDLALTRFQYEAEKKRLGAMEAERTLVPELVDALREFPRAELMAVQKLISDALFNMEINQKGQAE